MDNLKKELYCLILLEKNGIPLNNLDSEYYNLVGTKINYDKLKYKNLESLLLSMSDCIVIKNVYGEKICFAIGKKEVEDLKRLIDGQKSKSKKSRSKSKNRNFKYGYSSKPFSTRSRYEEKENTKPKSHSSKPFSTRSRYEEKENTKPKSHSSKPFSTRSRYEEKENTKPKSHCAETKPSSYKYKERNKNLTSKYDLYCEEKFSKKNAKYEYLSARRGLISHSSITEKKEVLSDRQNKKREDSKNEESIENIDTKKNQADSIKQLCEKKIITSHLTKAINKNKRPSNENHNSDLIGKILFIFNKLDETFFEDHLITKYNETFRNPLPDDWLDQLKICQLFEIQNCANGNRVSKSIKLRSNHFKYYF